MMPGDQPVRTGAVEAKSCETGETTSLLRRALDFAKQNRTAIMLGGVGLILAGGFLFRGREIARLTAENQTLQHRIGELASLCEEKDAWFNELISDGLRHGSSLAGKCMADRRGNLLGK